MHNSFKKWPLNPWWISNKTIMEVGNITKAAAFKSFLHQSYKNTQILFLTVLFNFFMRQTLTNDFWGLHKNINCAFPLGRISIRRTSVARMTHFAEECFLFNIQHFFSTKSTEILKLLWFETWYTSVLWICFYRSVLLNSTTITEVFSPVSFLEMKINNVLL